MPIQWFPGHMHATQQAIAERLPQIDVVIELLDARLPGSSSNPLLAELTRGKPALKILNKQDLADPECTALWLQHFNALPDTAALALDASDTAPARQLVDASRALAPLRGGMVKPLRIMICGVPNVGKSTLINTLVGKRAAKAADEPGITKTEQRITLQSDVYLFDTPGLLWPRISVEQSGYHLAAAGSVGRNAYDEEEVALELLAQLKARYAQSLQTRYGLDHEAARIDSPASARAKDLQPIAHAEQPDAAMAWAQQLLAAVGRRRGGLRAGGQVDLQKAGELTLKDFRSGAWGRVSLETPQEFLHWQTQGEAHEARRAAKLAARKAARRTPRGPNSRAKRGPPTPA